MILLGPSGPDGRPELATLLLGAATLVWAVVVDQGTKLWASQAGGTVAVLQNPAYAFGSVSGSRSHLIGGTVVIVVLFAAIIVPLAFRYGIPAWIPGLVLGGMASNLIDRVRFGGVRDFVPAGGALINVADTLVFAGVLLTGAALLRRAAPGDSRVHA